MELASLKSIFPQDPEDRRAAAIAYINDLPLSRSVDLRQQEKAHKAIMEATQLQQKTAKLADLSSSGKKTPRVFGPEFAAD